MGRPRPTTRPIRRPPGGGPGGASTSRGTLPYQERLSRTFGREPPPSTRPRLRDVWRLGRGLAAQFNRKDMRWAARVVRTLPPRGISPGGEHFPLPIGRGRLARCRGLPLRLLGSAARSGTPLLPTVQRACLIQHSLPPRVLKIAVLIVVAPRLWISRIGQPLLN